MRFRRALHSCLSMILAAGPLAAQAMAPPAQDAAPAWKPFDLGTHHRAVSTKSPAAQLAFDQGLMWSFAFNHDEAMRAFGEAAKQDPNLAMAWWGIALVNGPHINNPVVDAAHAKAAWDALGEAKKRLAHARPVEKALIEALAARYDGPQPGDRKLLDEDYANAMAKVAKRFPRDADVATLYAESLMDVRPWDQWTRTGEPEPGTKELLAALRRALQLDPNHPGALHLTLHALEASPHPERALAAADRLRRLVPDAGHLVHMPSHIYARVGQWEAAAEVNERAMAADDRYKARKPVIGFYGLYMLHNRHFLAYTAMMEGRKKVSMEQTKAVASAFPLSWVKENAAFADAFQTVHWEAMKRFGLWEDLLKESAPDIGLPVSTATWHAMRATALAALGRVDEALAEQSAFEGALTKVPAEYTWGNNPAISVLQVEKEALAGEIAFRQQKHDEAIAHLQQAVRLEDGLKYDEPPDSIIPARHSLGAVLLAAGKPKEAEAIYREDLKAYPANLWSLLGLRRALAEGGKDKEAAAVDAELQKAMARSDIRAETSCLCVGRP
jgi:tetratricopeptide (TPR) repeat protein